MKGKTKRNVKVNNQNQTTLEANCNNNNIPVLKP